MKDHQGIKIDTKLSSERMRILNRSIRLGHSDKNKVKSNNIQRRNRYIAAIRISILFYGKNKKNAILERI